MSEKFNIKILISPLDWGLGHAARCVPIINHLLQLGCKVVIAVEGTQEKLLKTEFDNVDFVYLKGYHINYSINKRLFSLKIIMQLPKILLSIRREKKWLDKFISRNTIDLVISDNRYGFYSSKIPSVFITHQLQIKTPFAFVEKIIQIINYKTISKFSTCWIPDYAGPINLAGTLSHPKTLPNIPVQYIGGLSRLKKRPDLEKKYDILIIISGPEPQRTLLEKKLLCSFTNYRGKALFVRGLPGDVEKVPFNENITIINHLPATELEEAFFSSDLIISRSGYTTVMDICKLQKKSVLIPTPGQTEQEYLAKHLEKQGWCVMVSQDDFDLHESLLKSMKFDYTLPSLNMEDYKEHLTNFIRKCSINNRDDN